MVVFFAGTTAKNPAAQVEGKRTAGLKIFVKILCNATNFR